MIHPITIPDSLSLRNINLKQYGVFEKKIFSGEVNADFVKSAMEHINSIPDYSSDIWDVQSSRIKGNTMYLRRMQSSYCSICNKDHDNDNTMFIIFDSERAIAKWKCIKSDCLPKIFYREEPPINFEQFENFIETNKHIVTNNETITQLSNTDKKIINNCKQIANTNETNIIKYRITIGEEIDEPYDSDYESYMRRISKKNKINKSNAIELEEVTIISKYDINEEVDDV